MNQNFHKKVAQQVWKGIRQCCIYLLILSSSHQVELQKQVWPTKTCRTCHLLSYVPLRKKCFTAFWCGHLHGSASKHRAFHLATNHILLSMASHCHNNVQKATPCCLQTPPRDYFIFVFSCWKVKADFQTETASLLSLKIWSGVLPLQQFRLHF